MFRRAIITDEVSQDPGEAIRLALEFGLQGIEIRSAWEKRPHEFSQAEARTLRAMADDAGLVICALATPCFKCNLDDRAQVDAHFEMLGRCLDLCAVLRTTLARVFTFWSDGDTLPGRSRTTGTAWSTVAGTITDHLRRAGEMAQASGCRLGVEHEPSVFGSSAWKVGHLLAHAGHAALGAVWDPGNSLYDPEEEQPYPAGYLALAPYLLHVHVKDARLDPATGTAQAVALGEGDLPYPRIFTRLVEDAYAGFVSLETHYRIAAPLTAEAARLPGGAAFSAGGRDASRVCLRRWERMIAALEDTAAGDKEG